MHVCIEATARSLILMLGLTCMCAWERTVFHSSDGVVFGSQSDGVDFCSQSDGVDYCSQSDGVDFCSQSDGSDFVFWLPSL